MTRLIRLGVLAFAMWGSMVAAQTVELRLLADSVSIGARYRMVLSIRHQGERLAVFPDEVPDPDRPRGLVGRIDDFELLARIASGSRATTTGGRLDSVIYEVAVFEVDTVRAAPVIGLATEQDTLQIAGAPIWAPVRSFVPEDAEDVLDLAPLAEFPRAWWPWILAALVVALVVYLVVRRRKPEEIQIETVPEEPLESPFDEAERRLEHLSTPSDPDAVKPYYVELSDILRTYISRALDVHALESTTRELMVALRYGRRLDEKEMRRVKEVLQDADLVKFADYVPPTEEWERHRSETRGLIVRTETRRAAESEPEVSE